MEKRIVIATHAMFSEGIASSLKMIFGDAVPVECITAYVDLSVDYQDKLEKIVSEHDYEHAELVVLTDILGGSVNNEFMGLLGWHNFHLITGLNLALLFEVVRPRGPDYELLPIAEQLMSTSFCATSLSKPRQQLRQMTNWLSLTS